MALFSVAVNAQAPAAPKLTNPRNMASLKVNARPVFKWNVASGATRYVLEVLNPSDSVIISANVKHSTCSDGVCSYTAPSALATQGGYKWRVTAYNKNGSKATGYRVFGIYTANALEVLRLVNVQRCARNLKPLALNPQLTAAALRHSNDMANNNFFSHTGSDGSKFYERIKDAGYHYKSAAENIAAGYSTPAAVMNGWMTSDGHRKNILNGNYREMGLALVKKSGTSYYNYWTQNFGYRDSTTLGVCP
jgi:uncharacterized protein YkwD